MVNWKSKPNIEGTAKFDYKSIRSDEHLLIDAAGNLRPAFRFIDNTDDCQIEIFISKGKANENIALVKEVCNEIAKDLTMTLRFK